MLADPKISVLMPVYNGEEFLRAAISSILTQTFTNLEFIIIDDGSTDKSADIVREFKDERIVFIQRMRSGLVASLNHMIQMASCDWLARMDADDIALPYRFQRQWEYIHENPEVVAVGGVVDLIDERSQSIGITQISPCHHEGIMANLLSPATGVGLPHPAVLMKKEAVVKCGSYRKEFSHSEDKDLWLRLSREGKLASIPEPVLLLRKHDHCVSVTHERSQVVNGIAAIVCHLLWERTGIDMVQDKSPMWKSVVSLIDTYVEKYSLIEAKRCRRDLVHLVRNKSVFGLFPAVIRKAIEGNLIYAMRLSKLYRRIIDEVVAEKSSANNSYYPTDSRRK